MPEYVGNIDGGQLSGAQEVRGGVLSTPGQVQPNGLQIDIRYYGVRSWNGETGDVTYTAPVTSVNGQTGDITVTEGLTPLIGAYNNVTPTEVNTAILEGRAVCITMNTVFGLLAFTNFGSASGMNIVLSTTILYINGGFALFELKGDTSADTWHILMGTLAAEFQPEGSVSTPTITCSPTTTSINGITDVGTLPTLTDDVTNETLSFSWTQGSLPTQGAATSVMTGVTATSSTPSFTGTDSYGTVTLIVD